MTSNIAYYSNENIDIFEHSLIDPETTKAELEKIIAKLSNHNVVIAPLNNKISTVGAGLVAFSNPEVQLCYSQMGSYNVTDYSIPVDDCIIFKLSLI